MEKELLLMLPGPVPIPERVRFAMSRQAINHRSAEFGAAYADCVRVLKTAFGTTNDLFVISGSGTAGMEAAIASVGRDKEIACIVNGKFGERLYKISQRYGKAHEIKSDWGTPVNLEALKAQLEAGAQVVTLVHNETSAGIKNPAEEIGKLCRKHDALFIMDGITSIGGDVVEADKWGVDIAITGSQKCLAAPAGLAMVSVSKRAWERVTKNPPYYLDLCRVQKERERNADGNTLHPGRPALPCAARGLPDDRGGRPSRTDRPAPEDVRGRAGSREAWGLSLFPKIDELHGYSSTVTAIEYPAGVKDDEMRGIIKKMGIVIAGGQDHLKGKIFRIGSMGAVSAPEILATLAATQDALQEVRLQAAKATASRQPPRCWDESGRRRHHLRPRQHGSHRHRRAEEARFGSDRADNGAGDQGPPRRLQEADRGAPLRHRHGAGHARGQGQGQDVRPRGLAGAHHVPADDEQAHHRGLRPRGRGKGRPRARLAHGAAHPRARGERGEARSSARETSSARPAPGSGRDLRMRAAAGKTSVRIIDLIQEMIEYV